MSDTKQNKNTRLQELLVALETSSGEQYRVIRDEIFGMVGAEDCELLKEELKNPNHRRRMAAATNLGRLGYQSAVPNLIETLSDSVNEVREMAVFALGLLGDQDAIKPLLELQRDHNEDVRGRVLIALEELRYALLEPLLIRAMSDESEVVRSTALQIIERKGTSKSAAVVLRALLERDPDMQMRAELILDKLVQNFSDSSFLLLLEGMSLRERRLIINHFESRNLQYVYSKLYDILHFGYNNTPTADSSRLSRYGRLLDESPECDFLENAYGRDETVEELFSHFINGNRKSVLVVGESGTGKTAIIHELSKRLTQYSTEIKTDRNNRERPWRVLETSTTELITETRYLGEWETKLKKMLEVAEESGANILFYFTNPNDLIGAGAHSNSDENFADFFRPYLQRGQIHLIGETTEDELKTGLTRDPGFLRLFRQIKIQPMTLKETTPVLHQRILDLKNPKEIVIKTSPRGHSDRPKQRELTLPPRHIDIEPEVVDSFVYYARSFMTRSALPGAACDLLNQVVEMKCAEIDEDTTDKKKQNEYHFSIEVKDILKSLSRTSGIPLNILDPTVEFNPAEVKQWFSERLIGQEQAIQEIVNRLTIIKAGLNNTNRPLAVYFLVGPTGVGKTYFSKLLARYLFGDEDRLTRFDLSEYQGAYAVERLIGAPHNRQREGLLTEAIKNQPFSVILLDEFEKADRDIFSLFLQVFDDARMTDANGKTTDFRQTVILITSNLGASKTSVTGLGFGSDTVEGLRERIQAKMTEFFPPEFINRLDRVIPFDPLDKKAIEQLVDIEIAQLLKRRGFSLHERKLLLSTEARTWISKNGFSRIYGARYLLRVLEQHLVPPVARLLIAPEHTHGACIRITRRSSYDPDYGSELVASWVDADELENSNDDHIIELETDSELDSAGKEEDSKSEMSTSGPVTAVADPSAKTKIKRNVDP